MLKGTNPSPDCCPLAPIRSEPVDHACAQGIETAHSFDFTRSLFERYDFTHQPAWLQRACANHAENLRISVRRHAVAAQDLEFTRNHQVHRHGSTSVFAQHKAPLHVPPSVAQAFHRVPTSRLAAQGIQRYVGAAMSKLAYRFGNVLL